jgi:multidrug efflux pump subunit AcrA (membrane-fusion protein)
MIGGGPLFRPQATASFLNTDTRGTVLSIAPPSAVAVFGLASAVLLAGLAIASIGHVDVHVQGRAVVAPSEDPARLRAPFSTVVLSVDKRVGDRGKTGETVMTLELPAESRSSGDCSDAVKASRERVETMEKQIATLQEQKKADAELLATLLGTQLASERSRLSSTEQRCKQTEALAEKAQVRLPGDGMLTHVAVVPGQRVQGGEVVATFLPNTARLVVHAELAETHRAGVDLGRPVRLRFDACPYQENGVGEGRVTKVLDNAEDEPHGEHRAAGGGGGGGGGGGTTAGAKGFVAEIEVDKLPSGYCSTLRPGMDLTADIFVRTQRIAGLFFRPLSER